MQLSIQFIEFISGGVAACLAEVLTLPFDSIKVQIMTEPSASNSLRRIISRALSSWERLFDILLTGLDAALIRQLVFGTLRFGLYPVFQSLYIAMALSEGGSSADLNPTTINILAGFSCGAFSAAICNPTDLVKVFYSAH